MLEALSLTKTFGSHCALDRLDLRVDPGEIVCLLGANGAGKTTTINLFLGFLQPTSGEARVDGVDVRSDPAGTKRKLLYVPEQIALFGELSGLENLAYFAALSGVDDRSPAYLRECLGQAGLADAAIDRRAAGYSKGMRQKVGVALSIAKQARALLLDEPTSGLDPQASAEFHALIVRQRDAGAAVLMVTHDLFRAREVGTRIGLMREGRLRRMMPAADITASELENLYLEEMGAAE
ncbi:MAG TPA: ATP-binding cassette domain-containing protein [Sphingomicrobium sp.]|jgi:ABC-2 type transport system ATP-binding protein